MYLYGQNRGLGDDLSVTDLLSQVSSPVDLGFGSLSPLMVAGIGLLGFALLLSFGRKKVRKVKTVLRKRRVRKEQIAQVRSELKRLKAS